MPQPRIHATVVRVVGTQAGHLVDAVGANGNGRPYVVAEPHELATTTRHRCLGALPDELPPPVDVGDEPASAGVGR